MDLFEEIKGRAGSRVWVAGMCMALLGGAWAGAAALPLTWVAQSCLGHV